MTENHRSNSYSMNPELSSYEIPAQQGGEFFGEPMYPGLGGNPYGGGFVQRPTAPASPNLPAVPGGPGGAGGLGGLGGMLGNFNVGQLKTIFERLGGIDGILGTMGKVQKIVGSLQQMAPMLKLLAGTFGGKAATKNAGLDTVSGQRRKRRRKRVNSARKGSARRTSTRRYKR